MIMCLNPIRIVNPRTNEVLFVPCGKCFECTEKIRNNWSKRLSDTIKTSCLPISNTYGQMFCWFMTLTFDNEHLPLETDESIIDDGLGTIQTEYTTRVFKEFDKVDCIKAMQDNQDYYAGYVSEKRIRYRYHSVSPDGVHGFLNRKPLQDFFKRLRKIMDKYYDVKLQYFACGEYGGDQWDEVRKTHGTTRPHYHVLIWLNCPDSNNVKLKGYNIPYDKRAFFHRSVPALSTIVFRSIALKCWGQSRKRCFHCDPVRNIDATTRYCTKYILKANEQHKTRFNYCVERCPMFRTASLNIGLEGAMSYLKTFIDNYREGIIELPTYRKFTIKNNVGEFIDLALPPQYFRYALKQCGYVWDKHLENENAYVQAELQSVRDTVKELWNRVIASKPDIPLDEQLAKRNKKVVQQALAYINDGYDDVVSRETRQPYCKHMPDVTYDDFVADNPYCFDAIINAQTNLHFVNSALQNRYIDDNFEVDIEVPF